MDETIDLLKRQITSHLLPAFEPSFTNLPSVPLNSDDEGGDEEGESEEEPEGGLSSSRGGASSKSKARRKSGGSSRARGGEAADLEKRYRPVLKQLVRTTTKIHELLDRFEQLVTSIRVDDRLLLKITPVCLATLAIDSSSGDNSAKLQPVQHSAMSLLQTIFGYYDQHRSLIMEDVFGLFLKLPASKRHLRTFRLHYRAITLGVEGQNIQLITALVMLLLQSVVTKPAVALERLRQGESVSKNDKQPEGDALVVSFANKFAQSFLERCGRKEQGSEFRTLLGNLVEDLLTAFLLPEWPAAELLLQAFCILLLKDLYNTKSSGAESIYFLQSLDLLGKILSKLRELLRGIEDVDAHLGKVLADELRKAVVEGNELPEAEGRVVVAWFERVMSKRVEAMEVEEPLPTAAVAGRGGKKGGASKSRRGRKSQASELESTSGDNEVDEEEPAESKVVASNMAISDQDAARQLVMNYLSIRAAKGEAWVRPARELYLCGWIVNGASNGLSHPPQYWAFLEDQWEIPPRSALLTEDLYHCLSAEATMRLSHALALGRTLLQSFDGLLYRLLALLGQGQATWRARVMKAFTAILESDPMLMAQEQVKQSVIDRFQDEATSVRQATVDLVGKYVLQRPQLFEKYYKALIERLVDKGVSVRKTVVRISGEFLVRYPTHELRTEICRRLVERASVVKEEDTVKDLIRDTFQVMWFSDQLKSVAGVVDDEVDESQGASVRKKGGAPQRLEAVALQMVEVIAGLQNTDWLVALLHGLLFGMGQGEQEKKDRVKQRKAIHKRCEAIVESLVGLLLDLDEGKASPLNTEIPELSTPAKQLLGVIATLYVFSRANATFLSKHVDMLLPYLKAENHLQQHEEASLCHMVSSMVALVIPHLEKPDRSTFMQAVKDLTQITYKFSSTAIHSAIECLANIGMYIAKTPVDVLKLASTFYGVLMRFKGVLDFSKEPSATRCSAHRGLVVLGCICRYYKFKPLEKLLAPASKAAPLPKELTEHNIFEASYRLFSAYLNKDVDTEVQAVQALCSLFTGCMQLMLTAQRDGIVARIVRSKDNIVKLTGLRSFREVLVAEERRVESGAARESMAKQGVTLQQRVKGDQDAEASIVGGVIQEHIDTIMALLLDRDAALRSAALALLSVLHRQGLVNPLQTMPTLLALQGDPSPAVRGDAYRQVLIETEKHPEYISNRVMDGLCLSYAFQKDKLDRISTRMDEKDSSANGTQCIFGPIYASSIRSNRKYRFQFLRNLLSLFEEKTANEQSALASRVMKQEQQKHRRSSGETTSSAHTSKTQKGSLDPGFLAYAAKIVAYLPFEVQEEPLFVIYHISRLVSLEGSALLSEVKSLFQKAGLKVSEEPVTGQSRPEDDDSDDEGMQAASAANGDADEPDAMDVDGAAASCVDVPPALLSLLKDKCAACMAFCALLRLKFFLKNVYHLSDDKCLEYKPQEGGVKSERPVTKPDVLPELDLPDNLIVSLSEGPEVVRTLQLQFQEFRKLIRGDPADFKLHKPVKSTKGRRSSTGAANGTGSPSRPRGKRPAPSSTGNKNGRKSSTGNGKGRKQSPAAKKRRKSKAVESEDDTEDEEGESSSEGGVQSSDDDSD